MAIAKGKSVAHGYNVLNYALSKKDSEILKINAIGGAVSESNRENIALSCWNSMQESISNKIPNTSGRGNELTNTLLRFEISPSKEESQNLKTTADWQKLLDDWIDQVEKPFDVGKDHGKPCDPHLDIRNSKYVAVIHRDTDKPHIHLEVCRVDENGKVNCAHNIGKRSANAMNEVARQRNWKQASQIQDDNISKICETAKNILSKMSKFDYNVYAEEMKKAGYVVDYKISSSGKYVGYTINVGNCHYKASELGPGRKLTCSALPKTWLGLRQQNRDEQETRRTEQVNQDKSSNNTGSKGSSSSEDETSTLKIIDADFYKDKSTGKWKMLFITDESRFFTAEISTKDKNDFFSYAQGKTKEETFDNRLNLACKYANQAEEHSSDDVKPFFTQDESNKDRTVAFLTRIPGNKDNKKNKEEKQTGKALLHTHLPFNPSRREDDEMQIKPQNKIEGEGKSLSRSILDELAFASSLINLHQMQSYQGKDTTSVSFRHNGTPITLHILNSDIDKVFNGIDASINDATERESYLPLAASLLEIDKLQNEDEDSIFQFGDITATAKELLDIYMEAATDLSGKAGGGGVHGQLSRWDGKSKDDKPFLAGQSAVSLIGQPKSGGKKIKR